MTSSKILLYLCLFFIAGLFAGSFLSLNGKGFLNPQAMLYAGLIFALSLISVFWRSRGFVLFGFFFLFFLLGLWRSYSVELKVENNDLAGLNNSGQRITLVGLVSKEPDFGEKSARLTIKPEGLNAKILVKTSRYPQYQYGDEIRIIGRLKSPPVFSDFNYRDYLAKEGIYSVMDKPEIELIKTGNYRGLTSVIYAKILSFKEKLRESIDRNLSPPQSSILAAMILGDKSRISREWKRKLNIAGVRHITAISGMHVAILSSILMTIFIGLGLWRQQSFYFSLIFITLFIIMTGLQPSAIRAGLMGGLFLLAQYFGRMASSSRSIILAAALMLLQNPLLLRFDAGFQLSFLAMMGIIYLMPLFQGWLRRLPNPLQLRNILAMTLSAQVFTLPMIIYNFGYLSLVAPLTNILVIPLLYWIMLFGFVFGLAGMIFHPLGWLLSFPSWLLLTYLTGLVNWFSSLSFASISLRVSWIWLILFYLALATLIWRLEEGRKIRFLA